MAGLVTALCGVALLVSTSLSFSATALRGDALGLITTLFYAGYLLAVKALRERYGLTETQIEGRVREQLAEDQEAVSLAPAGAAG